jgi:tetratricopeptide (TPR) repeat protein
MKLLSSLTITIALAAPVLAQTPAPAPSVTEAQAKQELLDAARAYREGKFAEAQAHSERALLLDPQNRTAPIFVARTIHAQFKPGILTPENIDKAQEAIVAYQRILERTPDDDEAYKAIAYLYSAIKEEQLLRQWILQRASDVSIANDKRAEAFIVLASKEWDCSFQITEQPNVKIVNVEGRKADTRYRKPKDPAEFERAKECSNRGLEMANMAITLSPENETAWSYRTNILLELEKLAEMVGDLHQKSELHQQYEEALSQTTKLSKRAEANPPDRPQL